MLLGGSRMFKNAQSFKVEYFECQTKGVMSDSILQNWTLSAFECYKLNCKCKNCPIKKAGYSFKCKMKYVVEHPGLIADASRKCKIPHPMPEYIERLIDLYVSIIKKR